MATKAKTKAPDDELVKQMLESALADLRAFHSKYYTLKSITGFMEAIESTLESLEQAS